MLWNESSVWARCESFCERTHSLLNVSVCHRGVLASSDEPPASWRQQARPFTPGPRHHGSLCSLIPHWLYVLNKNAVFTLYDWGIFRRHGTNVSALFQRLHCEGGLLLFNPIQPIFNSDIFAHANHLISANCAKTYWLFSLTKGLHGHSRTCCSSKRMKWDILVEPVEWNANKTCICEKYVIKSNKRLNDLS